MQLKAKNYLTGKTSLESKQVVDGTDFLLFEMSSLIHRGFKMMNLEQLVIKSIDILIDLVS